MPTDIIITPGTGEIEFHNSQGTVCGKISTSGNNLVFSNEVGELHLGSDSSDLALGTASNATYVTGSTVVLQKDGGNVGIGTTTPSQKLHVSGGSILAESGASGYVYLHSTTNYLYGDTNGVVIQNAGDNIRFSVASDEKVRINSSGDVGIDATSPLGKLHVSTGNNVDSGTIEFVIGGTATNARVGRIIKNTSSPYTMTINASDNGGGDGLILNATGGNVGINTSSPGTKLDVNGDTTTDNLYLASSIIHEGDTDTYIAFESNTQRFFAAGEEMIKFNSSIVTINEAAGSNDLRVKGNTDNNLLYTDGSADKVGIGTVSPSEKLEVVGNIRLGDGAARDIIGPTNENLRILANPNSSTEGIIFSTDGGSTTEMFIQDGGNVGINMTSPISTLHIGDGNDTISSALYSTDILNISAQNTAPGFNIISAGSSTYNRGVFKATRSRGTLASPTAAVKWRLCV